MLILEKEVSVERHLPLEGLLTVNISQILRLDSSIMKSFLKVETQIFPKYLDHSPPNKSMKLPSLAFQIDVFGEDSQLNKQVQAVETTITYNKYEEINAEPIQIPLPLNSKIIDYFYKKSAICQLRQYFLEEGSQLYNMNYPNYNQNIQKVIVLGECRIPLLGILTSTSGIKGSFDLINDSGGIIGSIELTINYYKQQHVIEGGPFLSYEEHPNIDQESIGQRPREYSKKTFNMPFLNQESSTDELIENLPQMEYDETVSEESNLNNDCIPHPPIHHMNQMKCRITILIEYGIRIQNPLHCNIYIYIYSKQIPKPSNFNKNPFIR